MIPSSAQDESPPSTGTVGLWLFLAALFMLFGSSLLGYVMIRTTGERSPAPGSIHLPTALWLSTALVIAVSITIARALALIRAGQHRASRNALVIALSLAAGFVTVQTPALILLLMTHKASMSSGIHLYGLIFFLILLHALHVLGGIIALARPTFAPAAALSSRGVRHLAMYWHFLDAIWIAMFTTFLLLG